jgi:hypothetical protein
LIAAPTLNKLPGAKESFVFFRGGHCPPFQLQMIDAVSLELETAGKPASKRSLQPAS